MPEDSHHEVLVLPEANGSTGGFLQAWGLYEEHHLMSYEECQLPARSATARARSVFVSHRGQQLLDVDVFCVSVRGCRRESVCVYTHLTLGNTQHYSIW